MTSLLDLSDDSLTRILTFLFGPNPSLQLRSLSEARNSFALALCNRRLLSLFCRALRSIDATGVPPGFPRVFSPVRLPRYEKIPHLASVARLASYNLSVIRLPNARYSKVGALLSVVAHHCPRLQELAYFDDGTLSQYIQHILFAPDSYLNSLEITNPRNVFKALSNGPFLTKVTLLNIHHVSTPNLISFLTQRGRHIRHLRLSITSPDLDRYPSTEHELSATCTLMDYISTRACADLPILEHLDLSPFSPQQHAYAAGPSSPDAISRLVSKFKKCIGDSRANNCGRVAQRRLHRLALEGPEEVLAVCLEALDSYMFEDTEIELQFPGATTIFPPSSTVGSEFYVKAFCFDSFSKYYAAAYESLFGNLKSLTFRCCGVLTDYEASVADRETLKAIATRAGSSLREIRFCLDTEIATSNQLTCNMVCDILRAAGNVRYVELPRSIVELATRLSMELMLSLMGEVQVIRLYTPFTRSMVRQRVSVVDLMLFSRTLPQFLKRLAHHCPQLQCLYMNMSGSTIGRPKWEALGDLDLARKAVKEFEEALPQVDARSVSAELERWAISGMNPASLSAPFLSV